MLRELQDDVARLTNCLFGSIILGMQHAADPKGTPEYNLDVSMTAGGARAQTEQKF